MRLGKNKIFDFFLLLGLLVERVVEFSRMHRQDVDHMKLLPDR